VVPTQNTKVCGFNLLTIILLKSSLTLFRLGLLGALNNWGGGALAADSGSEFDFYEHLMTYSRSNAFQLPKYQNRIKKIFRSEYAELIIYLQNSA